MTGLNFQPGASSSSSRVRPRRRHPDVRQRDDADASPAPVAKPSGGSGARRRAGAQPGRRLATRSRARSSSPRPRSRSAPRGSSRARSRARASTARTSTATAGPTSSTAAPPTTRRRPAARSARRVAAASTTCATSATSPVDVRRPDALLGQLHGRQVRGREHRRQARHRGARPELDPSVAQRDRWQSARDLLGLADHEFALHGRARPCTGPPRWRWAGSTPTPSSTSCTGPSTTTAVDTPRAAASAWRGTAQGASRSLDAALTTMTSSPQANYTMGIHTMRVADLNKDGRSEVLAGTGMGVLQRDLSLLLHDPDGDRILRFLDPEGRRDRDPDLPGHAGARRRRLPGQRRHAGDRRVTGATELQQHGRRSCSRGPTSTRRPRSRTPGARDEVDLRNRRRLRREDRLGGHHEPVGHRGVSRRDDQAVVATLDASVGSAVGLLPEDGRIASGDLDGDGRPDLIATCSYWTGEGMAAWQNGTYYALGHERGRRPDGRRLLPEHVELTARTDTRRGRAGRARRPPRLRFAPADVVRHRAAAGSRAGAARRGHVGGTRRGRRKASNSAVEGGSAGAPQGESPTASCCGGRASSRPPQRGRAAASNGPTSGAVDDGPHARCRWPPDGPNGPKTRGLYGAFRGPCVAHRVASAQTSSVADGPRACAFRAEVLCVPGTNFVPFAAVTTVAAASAGCGGGGGSPDRPTRARHVEHRVGRTRRDRAVALRRRCSGGRPATRRACSS